jgi:hypothetical protein
MREYLINAGFDLSLRPRRHRSAVDGSTRLAAEMPYHLLLLGVGGDRVLVENQPDRDWLAYVERLGFGRPATRVRSGEPPDAEFVPFGWNDEAVEHNRHYLRPSVHPPLEVLRRVNGRRFAAQLEDEIFGVREVVGVFDSADELEAWLTSHRDDDTGWILKSEHGNAGLGNRRLRSCALDRPDREWLRRQLAEDAWMLVERWRRRVLDIAAAFTIDRDGGMDGLELYEVVNTADGAYIGSLFDRASESIEAWRCALMDLSSKVSTRLAENGYLGPVCLDAFVWLDEGERRLRPLADLNARLQVSAPMLRLWQSWGREQVLYWRLFATRKLRLPTDFRQIEAVLGDDAFDPSRRRGVLVTSPLAVAGRPLRRVGVLLAGGSRAEVMAMDCRLRVRFER